MWGSHLNCYFMGFFGRLSLFSLSFKNFFIIFFFTSAVCFMLAVPNYLNKYTRGGKIQHPPPPPVIQETAGFLTFYTFAKKWLSSGSYTRFCLLISNGNLKPLPQQSGALPMSHYIAIIFFSKLSL